MADFNLGSLLKSYAENNELHVLEPGTHTIEIVTAKSGTAAKGAKISIFGKVALGPNAGVRVGLGTLSFSEAAAWKTMPLLFGMGVTKEFMQQADTGPDPVKTIADSLVGRVIDADVTVEPYQGEDRNRLQGARLSDVVQLAPPAPMANVSNVPSPAPPAPAPPAPADAPSF